MSNNAPTPAHEKLRYMDHLSLRDMADFFEHQAELIRNQSNYIVAKNNVQARQSVAIDILITSPRIVLRLLQTGQSLQEAQINAAKEIGAPVSTIENGWKRFCYDKSHYELKRRNRLILELAAMGFSNSDIGKKVFLHPNSVSRIITSQRKIHRQSQSYRDQINLVLQAPIKKEIFI